MIKSFDPNPRLIPIPSAKAAIKPVKVVSMKKRAIPSWEIAARMKRVRVA